ncbi:MAG: hypothetical protein ACK5LO_05505 [Leucobacter sp.]
MSKPVFVFEGISCGACSSIAAIGAAVVAAVVRLPVVKGLVDLCPVAFEVEVIFYYLNDETTEECMKERAASGV